MPMITNINTTFNYRLDVQVEEAENGVILRGPDADGKQTTRVLLEEDEEYNEDVEKEVNDFLDSAEDRLRAEYDRLLDFIDNARAEVRDDLDDWRRRNEIINE